MPLYRNTLTQAPANRLAYQDTIGPTPRNELLGYLADLAASSYSPQRTQQMQGVAKFLSAPAISQTLDRLSYGEPLTTGRGMTTRIRPEALEAGLAVAPLAQPVTLASLQAARAATQAAMRASMAGERLAERVVPGIMERGGLPAEMLQGLAQGSKSFAVLPAFHGTNATRIAEPKSKLSGMVDRTHFPGWFSEKPELANYYATARGEGNPSVLPVNLNIKKPLSLNFDMNDKADAAYEAVKKLGLDPDFYPELANKNWAHEVVNTYTFKKAAQEAGFDAIKVLEDGAITYAPLKESGKQIKSRFEK